LHFQQISDKSFQHFFCSEIKILTTVPPACVADVYFSFPGRESEQAGVQGCGEKELPTVKPKHFTKLCSPTNREQ